jgi:membrane protein YdbS with pleckstrin-like domain
MSAETGPNGPEAERVIASLRSHGRALFLPSLALIIIVGIASFFAGTFDAAWENWAVIIVAAVLALFLWVLPLFSWLARRYVITTRRVILRHGLFVRTRQELLHSRGYDVTVRKNALQGLFRSGNVEINTGLDHPVVLVDVPGADLVQEALHDLMESNQNLISARRQQAASRPGPTGPQGQGRGQGHSGDTRATTRYGQGNATNDTDDTQRWGTR